jgi:hypothetical protein
MAANRPTVSELAEEVRRLKARVSRLERRGPRHQQPLVEPLGELFRSVSDTLRRLPWIRGRYEYDVPIPAIGRVLATLSATSELAFEYAIKTYLEAHEDVRVLEDSLQVFWSHLPSKIKRNQKLLEAAKDLLVRSKRQLSRRTCALEDLGVNVEAVESGTRFDAEKHTPVDFEACDSNAQADTVAYAKTPVFSWPLDHLGHRKTRHAEVVVYRENGNGHAGHSKNGESESSNVDEKMCDKT